MNTFKAANGSTAVAPSSAQRFQQLKADIHRQLVEMLDISRIDQVKAERLRRAELRDFEVGCLHGRLKPDARREVMARFKARELDVLVATTVIEVGVDVPNATVMIFPSSLVNWISEERKWAW